MTPVAVQRPVTYEPIEVGSEVFHQAIHAAKEAGKETDKVQGLFGTSNSKWFGAFVHTYSKDEYQNMETVVFDEGKAGFALKSRDVVSVFKHPECTIKALEFVMPEAIKRGGKRLDCFNRGLPAMYAKFGFSPVAKVAFNEEFAPEGWNYVRDNHPDVVFMVYRKAVLKGSPERPIALVQRIKDEIERLPHSTYEEAVAIQMKAVETLE